MSVALVPSNVCQIDCRNDYVLIKVHGNVNIDKNLFEVYVYSNITYVPLPIDLVNEMLCS